mmetsp:Transcript_49252/g.111648  ORF Transcript_49252/g.111648 Transcript_49252/m.111648 type:complete len:285 (+) Transcript_49252:290-1144(+)
MLQYCAEGRRCLGLQLGGGLGVTNRRQSRCDDLQSVRVVNGRRHLHRLAISNASDVLPEHLATAGLRKLVHGDNPTQGGNGPNLLTHGQLDLVKEGSGLFRLARDHHAGHWHLPLSSVQSPDHRGITHTGLGLHHRLDLPRRKPVGSHVNHIIRALQHRDIPVGVDHASIARGVVAWVQLQVPLDVPLVVVPQGRKAAGGKRKLHSNSSRGPSRHLVALVIQHLDVVPRQRQGATPRLHADGRVLEPADRPAGLRLPPIVHHIHVQLLVEHLSGGRVAALPSNE